MAESAEAIVDSILRRLRDPLGEAHSRTLVLDIYSRVQALLNAFRRWKLAKFPLATVPGKAIYEMDADVVGLQRVTNVDFGVTHVDEVTPWHNLWKLSPTWYTDAGQVRGWAMIGLGLLAIWPTPSTSVVLTLSGPEVTPGLTDDSQAISFRKDDADIARDLTVALLLFRWRDLDMASQIAAHAGEIVYLHDVQTEVEEAR